MVKVRFIVNVEDYRPVTWPIKHPYWCSGYRMDGAAVLVAYVSDLDELAKQWPEAEGIDVFEENVTEYSFSSRFPQPAWFNTQQAQSTGEGVE